MNTNRFESPRPRAVKRPNPSSAGPAWWGLAIVATLLFILAIRLLTHTA